MAIIFCYLFFLRGCILIFMIEQKKIGEYAQNDVILFTIKNEKMSFSVMNYGCIITNIFIPDKNGKLDDIVLGFSSFDDYCANNKGPYFGAIIGRYANRIKNGAFSLQDTTYQLVKNDGNNTLHGGKPGFDEIVWDWHCIQTEKGEGICFTHLSTEKEQGFPGDVLLSVSYILTDDNELIMEYQGKTSKLTPLSLTNHTYFNLNGSGSILNHEIQINSGYYVESDEEYIPTGRLIPVAGTNYDFRTMKKIGKDIDSPQVQKHRGYDESFVIFFEPAMKNEELNLCAQVLDMRSGRKMEVFTNQPGVQFFTGNFLNGLEGKNAVYNQHYGFCLETQQFPDSMNNEGFPRGVLHPNEIYSAKTVYKFGW